MSARFRHAPGAGVALLMLVGGASALPQGCGTAPPPSTSTIVAALTMTPPDATLTSIGQQLKLTVARSPATTLGVTFRAATWTSSDPSVVTVDDSGTITARGEGTASVTAVAATIPAVTPTPSIAAAVTVDLSSQWRYLGAISTGGGVEINVHALAFDRRFPETIWATAHDGLFLSRDLGATWVQVVPITGVVLDGTGPVVVDPGDPDRIWYSPRAGPLYRSTDGGASWATAALPTTYLDPIVVSRFAPGTILAGTQGWPTVWSSTDGGFTWAGLPFGSARPDLTGRTDLIAWTIAEDPIDGTLYVPIEIGAHPQPYHPPIMRSTDRGATWVDVAGWDKPTGQAVPWHGTSALVDESRAAFVLTEGWGLWRSADHGDTWTGWGATLAVWNLIHVPGTQRFFGAGVPDTTHDGGLFTSSDDGRTWVRFGMAGWACTAFLDPAGTRLFAACSNGIYVADVPSG